MWSSVDSIFQWTDVTAGVADFLSIGVVSNVVIFAIAVPIALTVIGAILVLARRRK